MAGRLAAGGQLRTAVRVEIGLAGALIVVAALMSASEQPEQQLAAEAQQAAVDNVETTNARAAAGEYVARVRTTRTGIGDAASTVFEVALRTATAPTASTPGPEGTPVTIPGARSLLTSDSGVRREVPLRFEDVGRWASPLAPIAPGRYRLITRFGRKGPGLTFPVDVRVPAAPRDVVVAAKSDTEAGARVRARRALVVTLAVNGLLAGLAGVGLWLRMSRRRPMPARRRIAAASTPGSPPPHPRSGTGRGLTISQTHMSDSERQ